jgi:hypothetical protein
MAKVEDILKKYSGKISKQVESFESGDVDKDYVSFKQDSMPELSRFENWARAFGKLLKINLSGKDAEKMQKNLNIAHLDISPNEVLSYSLFGFLSILIIGFLLFMGGFFIYGNNDFFNYVFGAAGLFLFLIFLISLFVFYYIYSSPNRLAKMWQLKASSQMVPCILYVVVYMKHTSNLERAIQFASQHLQKPLSLDLKKIFWNVEVGKFSTIKESLDDYLKSWEDEALEFVEAFHLIESSLFEPSNSRRVQTLEKSLQVILDGVYEKTMVFSRGIRSPLTNLYMLGIVLPTLGLALLPLASTLLQGMIKTYHVFILFNLVVPFFVFYLANQILLKRPGGYGESEDLKLNPDYPSYVSKKPYVIAGLICFPLLFLGLIPFLFQVPFFLETFNLQPDYSFGDLGISALEGIMFFDFKDAGTGLTIKTLSELNYASDIVGPFGLGALFLSLLVPLSFALFFSIAYSMKTKKMIKFRDYTKQLEQEFTNSLFQLGNRLGDGMPAEMAFSRVAESTKGQKTADFFKIVNLNLHQAGMSLDKAIFDVNRGAIIYYPSQLIATSMRILLESVNKGLTVAAEALMSISEYIKNIHKVEARLRDLLAEVVSDMKGNITFLAPLLSGIVIGLTAMIAFILNKLLSVFDIIGSGGDLAGFDVGMVQELFNIVLMVPPYFIQISIGLYLVQIVFILTRVLVVVDSGDDRLKITNQTSKNLTMGLILYFVVATLSIVVLNILAAVALSGLGQ